MLFRPNCSRSECYTPNVFINKRERETTKNDMENGKNENRSILCLWNFWKPCYDENRMWSVCEAYVKHITLNFIIRKAPPFYLVVSDRGPKSLLPIMTNVSWGKMIWNAVIYLCRLLRQFLFESQFRTYPCADWSSHPASRGFVCD